MKRTLALILALAIVSPWSAAAQVHTDVVYGTDDRVDLYQVSDARLLALAASTAALFQAADVSLEGGAARLATKGYGASLGLCKEEPFYEQGAGAFCSGALVAPDLILTAAHCVSTAAECAGIKFVFGFAVKQKGVQPAAVPAADVYGCKELAGVEQVENGADWALVRLDRPVAGRAPLKLNPSGAIAAQTEVLVIGNPEGLPTKIAGGARVRASSRPDLFVANLDTYAGSSGSPVFNAATGLVEGILTRGEDDFVKKGECLVSKVCPADGCRGEDVTRVSRAADKIPAAAFESRAEDLQPEIADMLSNLGAEPRP